MSVLVSVVVPTYQGAQLLERCLRALVAQSFDPALYEIVVADDADDPLTKQQVLIWRQRIHGPTQILYVPVWDRHGSAAARNAGWRLAAGRVIAFTDDDTIPRHDWLASGFAAMRDGVAAAAGRVHVPRPDGRPPYCERDATRSGAASSARPTASSAVTHSPRSVDSTSVSPRRGARARTCSSRSWKHTARSLPRRQRW